MDNAKFIYVIIIYSMYYKLNHLVQNKRKLEMLKNYLLKFQITKYASIIINKIIKFP